MSNFSIAAYPGAQEQACGDFIRTHHHTWRVSLNPPKFDYVRFGGGLAAARVHA